ncbi:hypothetical protein [Paenibacillus harenae]|uniref:hypothetical protein n=1 Tax=Paenibacillus harenae TaxID=306543 RepID=UPI0003FA5C0C|nr:hypothetical protein [Paenibacillus harenae]
MIVRFGFAAKSLRRENVFLSKARTITNFSRLPDREAGIRRIEAMTYSIHIGEEYSGKPESGDRFIRRFAALSPLFKNIRMYEFNTYEWAYISL